MKNKIKTEIASCIGILFLLITDYHRVFTIVIVMILVVLKSIDSILDAEIIELKDNVIKASENVIKCNKDLHKHYEKRIRCSDDMIATGIKLQMIHKEEVRILKNKVKYYKRKVEK